MSLRQLALLSLLVGAPGCAAARGTWLLVDAEQTLQSVRETGAPDAAVYHWTMAEEYMRKAYEEWGYSDYEAAERLSKAAVEWAERARVVAEGGQKVPEPQVPEPQAPAVEAPAEGTNE